MAWTPGKYVLWVVGGLSVALAATGSAAEKAAQIDLKVLYAGNPASPRTADFVAFLKAHFATVETGDLAAFKEGQAGRFDVVVLDHDVREAPRPKFSAGYGVPTMTVGAAGAHIGTTNRLKTGYS
jgi:hypothetical protein